MPQPRRIEPSDTLENGFRVAHNETVDAMPDYSQCQVTDAGLLQFYNDRGQLLGEIDLSIVFCKLSDATGEGAATQFYSASETEEGVAKIATADDVEAGEDQFKFITPALLKYAFELLKQDLISSANKTLDDLAQDTPELLQDTFNADRAAVIAGGKVRGMAWDRLAQYITVFITESTLGGLMLRMLSVLSWQRLLQANPASSAAPYLTGNASYLGVREVDNPNPFGLTLLTKKADGSISIGNYLSWNKDRQLEIAAGDTINAVLSSVRNEWRVSESLFSGRVVAENVRVTNPELAQGIDYLFVGNRRDQDGRLLDADNTMHQQVVSLTTLVRAVINHPVFVASFGQPATADPISRTILCVDKYDTQSGPLSLSPNKIGTAQSHTLHLPAGQIFGRVSYPDGQIASGYALSYPDSDHYRVDYAGAENETSDLIIELYKRIS